jgi:hypothetical protein
MSSPCYLARRHLTHLCQGRSDPTVHHEQTRHAPTTNESLAANGNSSLTLARWLEEKEKDAPWTPEARS